MEKYIYSQAVKCKELIKLLDLIEIPNDTPMYQYEVDKLQFFKDALITHYGFLLNKCSIKLDEESSEDDDCSIIINIDSYM